MLVAAVGIVAEMAGVALILADAFPAAGVVGGVLQLAGAVAIFVIVIRAITRS
jgi:hypothetical protein